MNRKTLSDKRKDILSDRTGQEWTGIYVDEEDLKKTLKDFVEDCENKGERWVGSVLKEHFGDKLI